MAFAFIAAFLLGSLPTGYFVGRAHGVDIRTIGSGNVGATNVGRTLGKRAGIFTLLIDLLKGVVGSYTPFLFLDHGAATLVPLAGFCSVLGHCYSPFLGFDGGKGVATGLGAFLVASPMATVGALLVFLALCIPTKTVSIGSISAAVSLPLFAWLLSEPTSVQLALILGGVLVVARHKENISRLLAGTEKSFRREATQ